MRKKALHPGDFVVFKTKEDIEKEISENPESFRPDGDNGYYTARGCSYTERMITLLGGTTATVKSISRGSSRGYNLTLTDCQIYAGYAYSTEMVKLVEPVSASWEDLFV